MRLASAQRVPRRNLELYIQRNFVDAAECAEFAAMIDRACRPSTLANFNGDVNFRTSETCDLSSIDPIVAALEQRIADFVGIAPEFGEPLQGQRYSVGQEFKAHTDYFEPSADDFDKFCQKSGNRTWTVMIYLDRPAAGGATRFTEIDKIVQPEIGKALAWNNRLPDGRLNPATMHHGMKVRAGTKHILTKWFRERPFQF